MGRTHAGLFGAVMVLSACATPGIDYEARIMPKAPEAAELRNITVEPFAGPSGGWFASRLQRVLASAEFDGTYWFNVSDPTFSPTESEGIYSGFVEVTDVDEHFSEHYEERCVKYKKDEDGNDVCAKWKEFVEYCVSTDLNVSAFVEVREPQTDGVVFSASYPGSASDYSCTEYRVGRGPGTPAYILESLIGSALGFDSLGYGHGSPGALVREALSDTLGPIRRDVAPRNATVRAKFATKAVDPAVKEDPRFKQALSLGRKDPFASCSLWGVLGETYPSAPSVKHNLGACSEASGNYGEAQRLYAEANEIARQTPGASEVFERLSASMAQISDRRADVISLERLTGEEAPGAPDS